MENANNLYELNTLNEVMALDFTKKVAESKEKSLVKYSIPVRQCIKYMKKNINKKIGLSELSLECHLTPKYISTLFLKETGYNFTAYLEKLRIEEAKYYLTYTNYTYSEISELLTFSSQSYFIQLFKKHLGLTPKDYRNKTKV